MKEVIDVFHNLDISISYKRYTSICKNMGKGVCAQFQEDGLVCPQNLMKNMFTVGAIDNINHYPSSTTSSSFHGAAISVFQHPRNYEYVELRLRLTEAAAGGLRT